MEEDKMETVHIAIPGKKDENGMPISHCGLSFNEPYIFSTERYELELGQTHCQACWRAMCKARGLK